MNPLRYNEEGLGRRTVASETACRTWLGLVHVDQLRRQTLRTTTSLVTRRFNSFAAPRRLGRGWLPGIEAKGCTMAGRQQGRTAILVMALALAAGACGQGGDDEARRTSGSGSAPSSARSVPATSAPPAQPPTQAELNRVQLELEQARGRLDYLDDQVAFATISLDVRERQVAAAEGDGGGPWGIVDAWRDAGTGFVTVVGWIFVGAATIAPVVLLLALAFLAARLAGRRGLPRLKRPQA